MLPSQFWPHLSAFLLLNHHVCLLLKTPPTNSYIHFFVYLDSKFQEDGERNFFFKKRINEYMYSTFSLHPFSFTFLESQPIQIILSFNHKHCLPQQLFFYFLMVCIQPTCHFIITFDFILLSYKCHNHIYTYPKPIIRK